ncbi:MAG TPA: Uma2 family endonuclease [Clostridiales bacterium]|nr:Uma2 family endonuclease [Clostridiales bacterium]
MIVTTTEVQNNFGKYLKLSEIEDVIISRNGKVVAKLTSCTSNKDDFTIREAAREYIYSGKKVSYEEFLEISEKSELRYEYIDGEIYLLASPFYAHQKAIRQLFVEFANWFKDKKCEPLSAPFDVTLFNVIGDIYTDMDTSAETATNIHTNNDTDAYADTETDTDTDTNTDTVDNKNKNINVVQPDILVICDKENINEKGRYTGTPSLVVEILSESTRSKDLIKKLNLYMRSGVKEYWIVNTFSKEIYLYVFKDYNIDKMMAFKNGERAESDIFKGLGVNLEHVFD